ncbi:MAG: immunoglobulin domain-containing protein [Bacteroidales bacterium]|nr:immunoglobulin domain-containing protein [Bacteroidales bacterium]
MSENNIIVNKSTPKGAGIVAAYRRSNTTLTNYGVSSNNNLLYGGTPAANRLIFYDGTNSDQTLAAFKARVAPRETNSQTEDPNFSSIVGTDAGFLHIISCGAQVSLAESGAVNIATYTDDYDNEIRQGNAGYTGTGSAPDIGADEFEVTTATISYAGSPFCISASTPVTVTLTGTGSYTGGTFSSTAGLSINASTGAITPNTSTAGSYTVTYTKTVGACTVTATTQVTINALPPAPTISPATPCEGSTPTFTAGNGSIFEFTLNGTSQGAPSTNTTFTPASALTSTDQVCVRSYSPFIFDGSLTESAWGSPLATSAGGPNPSGFGAGNNLDALYIQSTQSYLFGGIAGSINSTNRVLLFIDCQLGGYNDLSTWVNRNGTPCHAMENLNYGTTFDAGFAPDYILGINTAVGDTYFDLYNMQTNTFTLLGTSNTSDLFGFIANSSIGDYLNGFEFAISRSALGGPIGTIKVFAMITDEPPTSGSPTTFLSNQFLTRANSGESNYGDFPITFGSAAPDPVSVSLSNTECYSETCATILTLPAQPGAISGNITPCIGTDLVYSVPNVAGVTYNWSFPSGWVIVSGQNTNSVTVTIGATSGNIQVTPSNSCGNGTAQTLAVNPMDVPAQPSVIAGATTPCEGTTQSYSVTNVSGVTYNWTFPAGWVQTGGGNTNSITVTVSATAGNIQVTPSNTCGNGTPRTLAVTPVATPTVNNNGPYTTCTGTGPNILLTSGSPCTYSWTIGTISPLPTSVSGASASSGNPINQILTNTSNTVNGSVQYIVTPTTIAGSCIGTQKTITVIVEPGPTVNPISNATYCSGVVVAASSFGSSIALSTYTWTSSIDIGFGVSGPGNIPAYTTVNLTGSPITTTISVVAKSPSLCTGPARTFTVTVNPTTIPTITADYCSSPGNIILTANPAGLTYQWYESGIPIGGATTQVITVDHASVYSVNVTNSYGCQGSAVLTVANELVLDGSFTNFNAATPAFITGYTQNQAYYDGTAGSGLYPEGFYAVNTSAWSNYPGAPQGYHNNFHGRDHTNNSIGSRNFMMINGSINTSQVIWQQTVTIQPNTPYYFSAWGMNLNPASPARLQFEIVTIQNGTEQVGSIADLNIAPKPTDESQVALSNWVRFYSTPFWTSPAGAVSATIRIINLNTDPGGNDFGLDDISFGTLSSAPATVSPTANGGGAVCMGGDLNLNANLTGGIPPFTFSWTGPNSFTSSLQNPVINNVNASHAGTYYLTVEDGYGCAPQVQSVVVVVSPVPVDPTSAQVDRNNFCADDAGNIELTATGGSGSTLSWYTGSCGGTLAGTGPTLIIPSPVVTTTYYARWESICGNSACVSVTVNVNTLPVAPTSITASATTLCAGTSLTLTANGGNGGSGSSPILNWYTESCGGTLVGTGSPLTISAPASNSTYFARWESSCGNSSCASIDITVNPLPQAPLTAQSDRNNFCEDDPGNITLSVTGGSGSTLNWYTGSCGGTLIGTGASFSLPSPSVATTYYASWQNGCGSSTCASVTVTVLTKPTAPTSASASPNPVCAGASVVLTATGGDGGTGAGPVLNWYSGSCGGTFVGSGSPLTITAPGINTTYYARWESGCGSSACTSVALVIDPLPATPTWNIFTINVCVPTTGVVFSVNPVPGALSYVWSYSAGNAVINAPSNTNSITMDFSAVPAFTTGTLSVYAVNACGNGTPATRIVRAYPEALVNAGDDQSICAGQNVSLTGNCICWKYNSFNNLVQQWRWHFSPNANTLNATYTPGITDITNGTVTLTLSTPKPSAPCPGPVTDFMVVTIKPAPIPVITGSNSACVGATGNIYSTAAGMSNYSWVVSAGGTITSGVGSMTIVLQLPGVPQVLRLLV